MMNIRFEDDLLRAIMGDDEIPQLINDLRRLGCIPHHGMGGSVVGGEVKSELDDFKRNLVFLKGLHETDKQN